MTELLRYTPEAERFESAWMEAKTKNQGSDLRKMKSQTFGSRVLGETLYDSNATDFYLLFDRDFFIDNYERIIDAHERLGTFETYIFLIKAALGEDTQVTFESPNAGHLKIYIVEASEVREMVTQSDDEVTVKTEGAVISNLGLRASTSIYTTNQVKAMLQSLEASGVFVEYFFSVGA